MPAEPTFPENQPAHPDRLPSMYSFSTDSLRNLSPM
jgi:hypothetical protein